MAIDGGFDDVPQELLAAMAPPECRTIKDFPKMFSKRRRIGTRVQAV
jgi:hypothetical protein